VTRRVRRRLSLLAVLVVLAGCGGSEPQATPAGFATRTVAQPSFSIALPERWRSFDSRSTRAARRAAGRSPNLRLELQLLGRSDSPIKLIGLEPSNGGTFLTNMNVLQTNVPSGLTFEQLARAEVAQIKLVSRVKELRQQRTQVAGGPALHLAYRTRSNALVHQYFVKHDALLYVLTYTTAPADAARHENYEKIFDLSAHTLQIG
jgi:hypothetical protein